MSKRKRKALIHSPALTQDNRKLNKKQSFKEIDLPDSIKESISKRKSNKYSKEYYQLLKLKREFLNHDLTIEDLISRLNYPAQYFFTHLKLEFENIELQSLIKEEHLIYCQDYLYDDLMAINKSEEQIISKTPQTKSNFYKLIYTK